MNKKQRTTFLLLGVVLIYAAIVVRFFMLRNPDDENVILSDPIATFTPTVYTSKDDFTITNDYRDPFLGTLSKSNNRKRANRVKTNSIETDYYPTIQYLGLVSDTGSKSKVLSLLINDKEYIIREGKTVDSVSVISGNSKSLKVSYKGKRKQIPISG